MAMLATIDVPWQNFRVCKKIPKESAVIKYPNPLYAVSDKPREHA